MQERITIKDDRGIYDAIIQNEMQEVDVLRVIYANLLWSVLMFLIGMLL